MIVVSDTSMNAEGAPVPPVPVVAPLVTPEQESSKSRHFFAFLNKYSIGLHSIQRSQVEMGKNTRVVTQEGVMKVVNSIKVHISWTM